MGFFLETLFGGLMAGMLYSLVALGFVLIFKASGVFNFAQGAMVLFAALAMARFSEWVPQWLGFESKLLGNIVAFMLAAALMFVFAWLVERLVLRHLVNQEGVTLLMATLGITYFLDGLGQTIFGSDIYQIDVGMPKDPIFILDGMFEGGVLINQEDVIAAVVAACLVAALSIFIHRHSAQPYLGDCVVRGWHHRAGGRHHLGLQAGGAVLAHHRGPARPARHHSGRPHVGAGGHHWRPHHRRGRELV
jgi:branched-chain amino acid transport system permease protein